MSFKINQHVMFDTICCGGCGIVFAVPENWKQKKMESLDNFHCPNGCIRHFLPKKRAKKAIKAK